MAAILKHWREAATLILVSKIKLNIPKNLGNNRTSLEMQKPLYNYEILMLKRSMKSKFMPSLYVFPGGVAEDADFSSEWIDIFRNTTKDVMENMYSFVKKGGIGPPMFSRQREERFQAIPSELAFRICAIRETFEESGVLLVRHIDYFKRHNVGVTVKEQAVTAHVYPLSESDLSNWRKKVDKDPRAFLTMCKEFNFVPDIWALNEWSNWLTPTIMGDSPPEKRSGRRYDTAFYLCMLDDIPPAMHDEKETVHAQWSSPDTLIKEYSDSGGGLAPPQVYEICRLLNFRDAEELNSFAWKRAEQRVVRYFPVMYFCQDGISFVYPGDDMYPEDPDTIGNQPKLVLSETLAEIADKYPRMNRLLRTIGKPEKGPTRDGDVQCNTKMPDGQVTPLMDFNFLGIPKPKL